MTNLVKLGKKGQLSIPRKVLDSLGVEDEQMMFVETTDDGAIVLRPAAVYPIEMYSDERISEFFDDDAMTPELKERIDSFLAKHVLEP